MKTPVAAALSIAGVLVAGSAAALVNSQVLSGAEDTGASAAIVPAPTTVELTVDDTTPAGPRSTTSTTMAPSIGSRTPRTDGGSSFTAYEVGEAGVVTLDVIDGELIFLAAEAASGWTIIEEDHDNAEDGTADEVTVVFRSGTTEVEFEAELVGGIVRPSVESRELSGSGSSFDDDGDDDGDDDDGPDVDRDDYEDDDDHEDD